MIGNQEIKEGINEQNSYEKGLPAFQNKLTVQANMKEDTSSFHNQADKVTTASTHDANLEETKTYEEDDTSENHGSFYMKTFAKEIGSAVYVRQNHKKGSLMVVNEAMNLTHHVNRDVSSLNFMRATQMLVDQDDGKEVTRLMPQRTPIDLDSLSSASSEDTESLSTLSSQDSVSSQSDESDAEEDNASQEMEQPSPLQMQPLRLNRHYDQNSMNNDTNSSLSVEQETQSEKKTAAKTDDTKNTHVRVFGSKTGIKLDDSVISDADQQIFEKPNAIQEQFSNLQEFVAKRRNTSENKKMLPL